MVRLYAELCVNVCVCMNALVPAILMYTDTYHVPKEFLQWAGLYTAEMLTNVTWSSHIDGWLGDIYLVSIGLFHVRNKSTLWMFLGQ